MPCGNPERNKKPTKCKLQWKVRAVLVKQSDVQLCSLYMWKILKSENRVWSNATSPSSVEKLGNVFRSLSIIQYPCSQSQYVDNPCVVALILLRKLKSLVLNTKKTYDYLCFSTPWVGQILIHLSIPSHIHYTEPQQSMI